MDDSGANLAANVRRLREARSLSQQQMARLARHPPDLGEPRGGRRQSHLHVLGARRA
jgi:hypothetical protein